MKELHDLPEMSTGARALLDETRAMDEPSPADRDRVKHAMLGAIAGGGALAATTAASSTAAAAGSTAAATTAAATGVSLSLKIAAAVLVAGAVGGTALVVTQPEQPATRAPVTVEEPREPAPAAEDAPVQPAARVVTETEALGEAVLEEENLEETPQAATLAPSAPRTPRPAVRAPPSVEPSVEAATPSSLQAEVALLRRAQRDIAAHDGTAALRHLDELARRFPDGVMGEERDAARVFALCESGRRGDAREAAQRFLRERPSSPLRARVAGACP